MPAAPFRMPAAVAEEASRNVVSGRHLISGSQVRALVRDRFNSEGAIFTGRLARPSERLDNPEIDQQLQYGRRKLMAGCPRSTTNCWEVGFLYLIPALRV